MREKEVMLERVWRLNQSHVESVIYEHKDGQIRLEDRLMDFRLFSEDTDVGS